MVLGPRRAIGHLRHLRQTLPVLGKAVTSLACSCASCRATCCSFLPCSPEERAVPQRQTQAISWAMTQEG